MKNDDSLLGYDERYKNSSNLEELFKIKVNFYKKNLLNKLESSKISVYEKLKIIEDNEILKQNPYQDIIDELDDIFYSGDT